MEQELEVLASIYGPEVTALPGEDGGMTVVATVALPNGGAAALTLSCSASYPSTQPAFDVEGLPRGVREHVVSALRDTAASLAGEGCLFQLIEQLRELVGTAGSTPADDDDAAPADWADAGSDGIIDSATPTTAACMTILSSPPTVVMKSVFVAHVARVQSREEVKAALAQLLQNSRVARATHNMWAYRFTAPGGGATIADNDDDGEDAAGRRLAHLLDVMDADGIFVVVSRWYGGVLLGPLRFKVIADTARQAIEASPWYAGRGTTAGAAAPAGRKR